MNTLDHRVSERWTENVKRTGSPARDDQTGLNCTYAAWIMYLSLAFICIFFWQIASRRDFGRHRYCRCELYCGIGVCVNTKCSLNQHWLLIKHIKAMRLRMEGWDVEAHYEPNNELDNSAAKGRVINRSPALYRWTSNDRKRHCYLPRLNYFPPVAPGG